MYHSDWWASAFLLLFGAWVLYVVVRPVRDYYVLQRVYFDRQYKEPWRGEVPGRSAQAAYVYYHGFDNYLAAKIARKFSLLKYFPQQEPTMAKRKKRAATSRSSRKKRKPLKRRTIAKQRKTAKRRATSKRRTTGKRRTSAKSRPAAKRRPAATKRRPPQKRGVAQASIVREETKPDEMQGGSPPPEDTLATDEAQ